MEKPVLHCGACMQEFEQIDDLQAHLKKCHAAGVMYPFINMVMSGNDAIGHPLAHLIRCCHKNAGLIRFYAHSISSGMNTFDRSKIHSELCDKLGLDYNKFRPFESSDIREIPTKEQAEKILWTGLFHELKRLIPKAG